MMPMNRPQNVPAVPTEEETAAAVGGATAGTGQSFSPPKRWAAPNGTWVFAAHQGVVMPDGSLRNYYQQGEETQIWYSMPDSRKAVIMDIFNRKGLSTSSISATLNSFSDLLYQANVLGESWETTLNRLERLPNYKRSGGPSYRVANPADLRAVAKAVFRETIGREATEDEAAKFVTSYQQAQRAGTGTVAAPSVEVAAQDFARIEAPQEAAAYGILDYIGQFANAAQGVGR